MKQDMTEADESGFSFTFGKHPVRMGHTAARIQKKTALRPLSLPSKHEQRRFSTSDSGTVIEGRKISTMASATKLECRAEQEKVQQKCAGPIRSAAELFTLRQKGTVENQVPLATQHAVYVLRV